MKFFGMFTMLTLMGLSSSLMAQGPNPQDVEIRDINVNGSGCPIGTASAIVTNSRPGGPADYFQITYDEFIVEKGPYAEERSRKFCNISLDIKFPQGWSFTMLSTEVDGYVEIGRGARGELKTQYSFPQLTNRKKAIKRFKSGFEGDYSEGEDTAIFTSIQAPCGRTIPLNIKTTLKITGSRRNYSTMTTDIQSGVLTQLFGLKWKRCY